MERVAFDAMARIEDEHWWFVGRRAILESVIKQHLSIGKGHDISILEAGCGTGGNLGLLQEFGHVDAFEYDDVARFQARSKSTVDVKSGHLPDGIDDLRGPYELIALLDVLEHLEQDIASLQALAVLLAPRGKLLITVPALQSLWSRHDEVHQHHRRYSEASLIRVVTEAGLKVEMITYFNSLLLPAAAMQRLVSRLSKQSETLDRIPPKPINGALAKVFGFERYLIRRMKLPIGLSLCAVCQAQ
ncbi:class I SAM-dependent methyltransferase [Altererythrobacter sp.]|uniref:class I SAM-dependent methyltransferase n=1 Tax=Altererythrobacter sp. TaxID=1872480 RepID=UPI002580F127|nr:class I SAM-dependent methyltransferase [Altererythrobacter sp.]